MGADCSSADSRLMASPVRMEMKVPEVAVRMDSQGEERKRCAQGLVQWLVASWLTHGGSHLGIIQPLLSENQRLSEHRQFVFQRRTAE